MLDQNMSSRCGSNSSLSSFMSNLLETASLSSEKAPRTISIVDDNARSSEDLKTLARRSLASQSNKSLDRWSHHGDSRDSDPNLISLGRRRQRNGRGGQSSFGDPRQQLKKSMSESDILRMPQRKKSPRITRKTLAVRPKSDRWNEDPTSSQKEYNQNATWDDAKLKSMSTRTKNQLFAQVLLDPR